MEPKLYLATVTYDYGGKALQAPTMWLYATSDHAAIRLAEEQFREDFHPECTIRTVTVKERKDW